ncbi:ACP S-malonyltransferase [Streptomyces platensis]|uniref:ACP S-malonyltransferase n=1 Tax=Streptomyces platensis TaxID=58346 RepID=UPI0036C30071
MTVQTIGEGRYALAFPGAGSQLPGMAYRLVRDHPAAREVLARADEATGLPLTRLCTDGTPAELRPPELSHPAVVATGLACAAALRAHLGARWAPPALVGGHSLGHFAALVEAGVLGFADALRIVAERARLMGEQARVRPALMSSVSGLPPDIVTGWCAHCPPDLGQVVIACYNGPRHLVVSGDAKAVRWVADRAAETPDVRVTDVATGVASHSPLMAPVQKQLRPMLAGVRLAPPTGPVLLNSDGRPTADVGALRADLLCQLEVPVRWHTALRAVVRSGIRLLLDTGPGQVMAKTARRHPELTPLVLNAMEPLKAVLPLG